jgi:hypothetical protein
MQVAYTEDVQKLPQPAAKIPRGHNVVLLEKIKKLGEREWKAIKHCWSCGKNEEEQILNGTKSESI